MRHYAGAPLITWLRKKLKIKKPSALGWGQWDIWEEELKKSRPVAFFLTETLPGWAEKPAEWIIDPIDNVIYYLRRRFFYRTHILDTGLAPGKYYDLGTRLLHGTFNEFQNYIECEKAWMSVRWEDKEVRKKYNLKWYNDNWYLRWWPWRCPQAGIDHLKWEMELYETDQPTGDSHQSFLAHEELMLYVWWVKFRKHRAEGSAWDEVGLNEFYKRMDKKYGDDKWTGYRHIANGDLIKLDRSEQAEFDRLQKDNEDLEQRWEHEDDEMLARLMKIRRSLWT
jgi:hypothetical protein